MLLLRNRLITSIAGLYLLTPPGPVIPFSMMLREDLRYGSDTKCVWRLTALDKQYLNWNSIRYWALLMWPSFLISNSWYQNHLLNLSESKSPPNKNNLTNGTQSKIPGVASFYMVKLTGYRFQRACGCDIIHREAFRLQDFGYLNTQPRIIDAYLSKESDWSANIISALHFNCKHHKYRRVNRRYLTAGQDSVNIIL